MTDRDTTLQSTSQYRRRGAIRVVLPGINDASARLDEHDIHDLTPILTEQLDEHTNIRAVEMLSFSGHDQQEHLLCPHPNSASPAEGTMQSGLRQSPDTTDSPEWESVTGPMAEAAVGHLPETVGVETVDADLSPLGSTPVRTGRLVLAANRELVGENLAYHPVDRVVGQLGAAGVPHVLQVLVRNGPSKGYVMTVRLVVLDAAATSPVQTGFADMITDGVKYDPADLFEETGLTSNFKIPIENHYKNQNGQYIPDPEADMTRAEIHRARRLYNGYTEYDNLLRGRSGSDATYRTLIGYPSWPVTDTQLRQFTAVSPTYYDESPWAETTGRNPPALQPTEVFRLAPGTDHGPKTDTTHSLAAACLKPANSETGNHVHIMQHLLQALDEHGFEVERVPQDNSSAPDGRVHLNDWTIELEVSRHNR